MMDLFNLVAKLTLDKSEFEKDIGGLDKTLGTAAKVGGAAIAATTGAVVAFGASSVKAGAEFDKAMAQVAATSGKSVDEIGELREFAQEMGATTAFSATQAAEALNYMALAGYDSETSMKMLPNVLNLAAAGGMELATASDMVTDAQTALGLSLDETQTMVDQMAKASSTTNTSVSQLGDALLTVGGNAKVVKGGTAELSSVLGALADNGIKGSEAGTHLRNILLAMNPSTDDAAAAWEQLGVQAYDAQGNLRPLEDIFTELNTAMDGMTDQEKQKLISNMFNKTDLAAVNALLATTRDRWTEIDTAVGNAQGSAEKMADTQLDNLTGDMTLFQSALEGVQIAVSDGLTPTLRKLVQGATTGLSKLTTKLTEYLNKDETQEKLNKIAEAAEKLINIILDNLDKIFDVGVTVITGIMDAIGFLIDHIDTVKTVLGMLVGAWAGIKALGVISSIGSAISAISSIIGVIGSVAPAIMALINPVTLIVAAVAGAAAAIILNWDKIKAAWGVAVEFFKKIWQGITDAFKNVGTWIADKFKSAWDGVKKAWGSVGQFFSGVKDNILNAFKNLPSSFLQVGKDLLTGLGNGIVEGAKGVVEKAKSVAGNVLSAVKGFFGVASPSKEFKKIGEYLMQGMSMGIEGEESLVMNVLEEFGKKAKETATDSVDGISSVNRSIVSDSSAGNYWGSSGEYVTVPQKTEPKTLTVVLQLDRIQFAKAVYEVNNEETQRVGVKIAGGYA